MKQDFSFFSKQLYASEVLGLKNYLCPESIYQTRSLKGKLPCEVLIVLFQQISESETALLKKIMNSLQIFDYSVLEIKNLDLLEILFSNTQTWAKAICVFGGTDLSKTGLLEQSSSACIQIGSLKELASYSVKETDKKKHIWEKLKKWKQLADA